MASRVDSVSFSSDGRSLAVALEPLGEVRVISIADRALTARLEVNRPKFTAFSPDGRWLAVTEGERVRVRTVGDWIVTQDFGPLWNPQFAFSPDSKLLAAATSHDVITLFPVGVATDPSEPQLTVKIPSNLSISRIMFTRDKRYLVAGTEEGTVYLWDLSEAAARLQALNVDWSLLSDDPSHDPPAAVPITVTVP